MNRFQSLFFTIPMGIGSSVIFYLSSWNGSGVSYFTDNQTYQMEIFWLWVVSAFYFFFDFVALIYRCYSEPGYVNTPNAPLYFIHHTVGLVSAYLVFWDMKHLIKFYLAYMTYELSTPFLNVIEDAYKNKIDSWFVSFSQVMFSVLFTLVRVIFGSWITYELIKVFCIAGGFSYFTLILPLSLQLLNYWWYYRIIRLWLKIFGCIKSKNTRKVKVDKLIAHNETTGTNETTETNGTNETTETNGTNETETTETETTDTETNGTETTETTNPDSKDSNEENPVPSQILTNSSEEAGSTRRRLVKVKQDE